MTKTDMLAALAGRDGVADLDVVPRDHDPVDQQFHQLPPLLERGTRQAGRDTPPPRAPAGPRPTAVGGRPEPNSPPPTNATCGAPGDDRGGPGPPRPRAALEISPRADVGGAARRPPPCLAGQAAVAAANERP